MLFRSQEYYAVFDMTPMDEHGLDYIQVGLGVAAEHKPNPETLVPEPYWTKEKIIMATVFGTAGLLICCIAIFCACAIYRRNYKRRSSTFVSALDKRRGLSLNESQYSKLSNGLRASTDWVSKRFRKSNNNSRNVSRKHSYANLF